MNKDKDDIEYMVEQELEPGELLLKVIIELVAKKVGMSNEEIGDFLTGNLKVTKEIDEAFTKVFKTKPGYWLDCQRRFDERQENENIIVC